VTFALSSQGNVIEVVATELLPCLHPVVTVDDMALVVYLDRHEDAVDGDVGLEGSVLVI
jgi:hypothetical protein